MAEPTPMRLRFPPSPTGFLHVGGARTALFNWFLARQSGGELVLRIEDTDKERSTEAHTRAIVDGLTWLGIDWDEGPTFQSDGVERHREAALRLLAEGAAYHDFTDPEALREEAAARGIEHPSALARIKADEMGIEAARARAAAGEPHAIRIRIPEGETRWDDLVHGAVSFDNADLDDFVILRSDGSPIYNLAVVCDDAHQRITHVVRGDDHLSNTPKQIVLYEALGLPVPRFAHLPMILGPDGKRLSKRHGATAVGDYAARGILPDAMVNFLALLGWNPGDEREVMSRAELIASFSLDRVQKKSAIFDTAKLEWFNGQHLQAMAPDALEPLVIERLAARGIEVAAGSADFRTLLSLLTVRSRTVEDLARQAVPYLVDTVERDADAVERHWYRDRDGTLERLQAVADALSEGPWEPAALEERVRGCARALGVGPGKVVHPLRVALLGQAHSPGIFDVLLVLGRERSLRRIEEALAHLRDPDAHSA